MWILLSSSPSTLLATIALLFPENFILLILIVAVFSIRSVGSLFFEINSVPSSPSNVSGFVTIKLP